MADSTDASRESSGSFLKTANSIDPVCCKIDVLSCTRTFTNLLACSDDRKNAYFTGIAALELSAPSVSDDFTIEFWMKFEPVTDITADATVVEKAGNFKVMLLRSTLLVQFYPNLADNSQVVSSKSLHNFRYPAILTRWELGYSSAE